MFLQKTIKQFKNCSFDTLKYQSINTYLNFIVGLLVKFFKHLNDTDMICRHEDSVNFLCVKKLHLSIAEMVKPSKFAAIELFLVKTFKVLLCIFTNRRKNASKS